MNNINQHAHDIAHAVFRVATLIHNPKLRTELQDIAVDFLSNFEETLHPISEHKASVFDRLERMISLAESTKEMKEINAQVLKRELNKLLNDLKTKTYTEKTINDINLSGEFDSTQTDADSTQTDADSPSQILPEQNLGGQAQTSGQKILQSEGHRTTSFNKGGMESSESAGELTERQTSILRKIRETPECRLRDLMATFQDISERTIRNEVRTLREHGLVQRIGNGGPNSYFESKEMQKIA